MEEREVLRLTFELPAEAMDRAARLLEAARLLLETGQAGGRPVWQRPEQGESAGFDEARYRALLADEQGSRSASASGGDSSLPAGGVAAGRLPERPTEAGGPPSPLPLPAADPVSGLPPAAPPETARSPEALEEMEMTTDPPALPPPDAPAAGDAGEMAPIPDPAVARPAENGGVAVPTAGAVVRSGSLPLPRTAGAEGPAAAEQVLGSLDREARSPAAPSAAVRPAPLTAEAVNLAFRRDDRRYDNGFPLY